jgi:hypothetical protein
MPPSEKHSVTRRATSSTKKRLARRQSLHRAAWAVAAAGREAKFVD